MEEYIDQKLAAITNTLQHLLDQQQPSYIIEELCMELLTVDLEPSKYTYICNVLEEEFFIEYHHLLRSGILRFEITNHQWYKWRIMSPLSYYKRNSPVKQKD
jgi:hypothetical protein